MAGRRCHRQHGKCSIVAAALTMIERSLLPDRPLLLRYRRAGAVAENHVTGYAHHGRHRGAAGPRRRGRPMRRSVARHCWPTSSLAVPYILWDNIARGTQISCPHIEKSCTSAYYADRKLGVSEASQHRCGNHPPVHRQQHRGKGRSRLAQRAHPPRRRAVPTRRTGSLCTRTPTAQSTRTIAPRYWRALYTILLGNPQGLQRSAMPRARPGSRCGGSWSGSRRLKTLPS